MINLIISAYGGFGGYSLSLSLIDNKKLSDYVSSKGYSEISNLSINNEGFGYFIFKNFIIGGFGFSGFSQTKSNSNKYIKTKLSGGGFSGGYIIYSTNKLLIYPTIVLGGYSYNMKLYEKTTDSLSGVINNPYREVELNASNFMAGILVNFTYFFYGGINANFSLGYNFGFDTNFNSESVKITTNEKFSFNNVYIKLGIGIGGYVKWFYY